MLCGGVEECVVSSVRGRCVTRVTTSIDYDFLVMKTRVCACVCVCGTGTAAAWLAARGKEGQPAAGAR